MNQIIEHARYRNVSGGSIIINDINAGWEIPDGAVLDLETLPEDKVQRSHDLRRLIAKNFLIPDRTETQPQTPPPAEIASLGEDAVADIADRVTQRLMGMLSQILESRRVEAPSAPPPSKEEIKTTFDELVAEHRAEVVQEVLRTQFPAGESSITHTEAVEASENVISDITSSLRGLRQKAER